MCAFLAIINLVFLTKYKFWAKNIVLYVNIICFSCSIPPYSPYDPDWTQNSGAIFEASCFLSLVVCTTYKY